MKEMYYVFCDEIQEWSARTKEEFFENFSEENVKAYLANPRCENYNLESLRLFGVDDNSEKDKTTQLIENSAYLRSIEHLINNNEITMLNINNMYYYFSIGQKESIVGTLNRKFQLFEKREDAVAELKRRKLKS